MIRFIGRRVLAAVVALVLFTFLAYWLTEMLIPGDFFTPMRLAMTAEEVEALRQDFGLDLPLCARWWRWLTGFASGSLVTTTGQPVTAPLMAAFSRTIFVFFAGLLMAYSIGEWLGRLTGWRRGATSDLVTVGSIGISSLFPPFLGFLFVTFIGFRMRPLRTFLQGDDRAKLWVDATLTEVQVFNRMSISLLFAVLVAAVAGWWIWRSRRRRLPPWLTGLIVVAVTGALWQALGFYSWAIDLMLDSVTALGAFVVIAFGEFLLIMQSGMAATISDDYIETARAKGLKERMIRDRHAARNASMAVVARLAVSVPYLLTGLVIVERAVGFGGVGQFLFGSIESQDIPAAVSTLAAIGLITLVVRLALDLMLLALDPRISRPGHT